MPKKHVFLSYCRENQQVVGQLRDDLRKAGEPVWWDQDIGLGEVWQEAVQKALDESYAFIVCFSPEAEARFAAGIYPELNTAIERFLKYAPGSSFIFPAKFAPCEIPMIPINALRTLRDIQHVDLYPPPKWGPGVQLLVKALQRAPERP